MRILIMGAGAVGSAVGGFLRLSGHDVTLVGRGAHLAALRAHGLSITGIWGNHTATGFTLAESTEKLSPGFDAILLCVKSFDTIEAAKSLCRLLEDETLLVSLQNGLGNLEAMEAATRHPHILGGRVIFGTLIDNPGHLRISVYTEPVMIGFKSRQGAPSALLYDKAVALCQAIQTSGIPCQYTDTIEKFLWSKLLYNCALNPLSAIHRVPYGALPENPEWKQTMDRVVAEIFSVAKNRGVALFFEKPSDFLDIFYGKLVPDTRHHRSSMLQDIEKGRKTEIDNLCGIVVKWAVEAGLSVPANQSLLEQVKQLETSATRTLAS